MAGQSAKAIIEEGHISEADARHPATDKRSVVVVVSDAVTDDLNRKVTGLGFLTQSSAVDEGAGNAIAAVVDFQADPELDLAKALALQAPVILLAEQNDFDFRLKAARAGVKAIVSYPVDAVELGAWLSDFDQTSKPQHKILIIDDDELASTAYAMALEHAGMQVQLAKNAAEAIAGVETWKPDLVLLDVDMPGANGLEVAMILRQTRQNLSLPIVFLSAERDRQRQQLARRIGGDDFVSKPVDLKSLADLVAIRADRALALRQVMEQDSMTGLLNHARFKDRLAAEVERSHRTKSPISVALVDLDHFKKVNDRFGHQAGDEVIQTLARSLTGALRRTDVVSRYGGEEFAIILLDTAPDHAAVVMDKIREAFGQITFGVHLGGYNVTMSVGLTGSQAGVSADGLIVKADGALYEAKDNGRDRVVIA